MRTEKLNFSYFLLVKLSKLRDPCVLKSGKFFMVFRVCLFDFFTAIQGYSLNQ